MTLTCKSITNYLFLLWLLPLTIQGQVLVEYNEENPRAAIHYNEFSRSVYQKKYDGVNKNTYPAQGTYSPTAYTYRGIKSGVGVCNYIYIPTQHRLEPGIQYKVTLTVRVASTYADMQYYQDHFGLTMASDLYQNHFGLWPKHFIPFNTIAADEAVTLTYEFRPLCASQYIVIGVFQGRTMDNQPCFACQHDFELLDLTLSIPEVPSEDFFYVCDAFEEKELDSRIGKSISSDTVYFDLGSSTVDSFYTSLLDGIPEKLRTSQDLVVLYASTDKSGQDNRTLGAARNEAIKQELIQRDVKEANITLVNFGDTQAKHYKAREDRHVIIAMNVGKMYQKLYSQALEAAQADDYRKANALIKTWLELVPQEYAIYTIFDCWGAGERADLFKKQLTNRIRSKFFYRNNQQKFTFDSMYAAFHYPMLDFASNYLPTSNHSCERDVRQSNIDYDDYALQVYQAYGFPHIDTFGWRANRLIPDIMVASEDLSYLRKSKSLIRQGCQAERISWSYYAQLVDKLLIKETGFQRYGTQQQGSAPGEIQFVVPIADVHNLTEYRRQVKLSPFPKDIIQTAIDQQRQIDTVLIRYLNTIYQADQDARYRLKHVRSVYGNDSREVDVARLEMHMSDSINLIKVTTILENRGWLGPEIVGQRGNETFFLVIQHADLDTQLKYLPMLSQAATDGKATMRDVAMLEDRIAVRQHKPQIYGTQVQRDSLTGAYIVPDILDPDAVDERRAKVGLGPIAEYLRQWGIAW